MTAPADPPPSAQDMDEASFRSFVADARWIFAKTMPRDPHWYTLRRDHDSAAFDRAVLDIRRCGLIRPYQGRDYTCVRLDGMIYWTMGAPLHSARCISGEVVGDCDRAGCTILINRTHDS